MPKPRSIRLTPRRNTRDWLRDSFSALTAYPATIGLVDPAHSPVWSAPLGADACADLLAFWRTQHADGSLVWSLADPDWDTRFLGDVYQDLSVFAKKKFALLQTPKLVEEFILDRTCGPGVGGGAVGRVASDRPPRAGIRHFLLGALATSFMPRGWPWRRGWMPVRCSTCWLR